MASTPGDQHRILHVLRTPVGGLFRHVADLARAQARRGHSVGLIADSTTGGTSADNVLDELSRELSLGITRVPISRHIGSRDVMAVRHVTRRATETGAEIIHGHGAKGGAYARLARAPGTIRVYTPHGGSLHYNWSSPVGMIYLALERSLMRRTDLLLAESVYGRDVFKAKVGNPSSLVRVVHNGVAPAEFEPIAVAPDATDLVFIGELRLLKGVDVLLDAIASLAQSGRHVTATIIGEGADRVRFEAQANTLQLTRNVRFLGAMPARAGFAQGHVLVVPSRAESLPYIVLEAAAAGRPLIATKVGGIAEIFGSDADNLIPAGDAGALVTAITATLDKSEQRSALVLRLQERVRAGFSVDVMTESILSAYRDALAARHR